MNDNYSPGVKEAMNYLKTGGLGEVLGLADISRGLGQPKVQMDTDMAIALCILASEALPNITAGDGGQRDD